MESNSLPAGMYLNMGPRMQGLEMSLQHHHLPQNPTTQMAAAAAYPNHNQDYDQQQQQHPGLTQFPAMQDYSFAAKPKVQTFTLSDDDEPGQTATMENSADDGKRKTSSSPWQRMKWTDHMVRQLIWVVYCIGDEVCSDQANNDPSAGKKKNSAVLQKKGKWKSVSMAMMEKGFSVSPQQCEDKFNDLNKRYKRVNDILGKGTACKVVENQSLLETMDLTPKLKEEVKKLLNSKHLYFKEMCIYHNNCGHGAAGGSQQSPDSITDQSNSVQHPPPQWPQPQPQPQPQRQYSKEENDDEEDDVDEDIDDDEYDDDVDDKSSSKRRRKGASVGGDGQVAPLSASVQDFSIELKNVLQDETKNLVEKRQWMKVRLMQLEEQHMGYDCEALELEKQRLKWLKYRSNKEREMDRDKLINERKKLENERMMLLLRHKEIDLINGQHRQSSSRTDLTNTLESAIRPFS